MMYRFNAGLISLYLLSSKFFFFASAQNCTTALLPFDNALLIDTPSPFFECFQCSPDPLVTNRAPKCSDVISFPSLNFSCTPQCQTQIDDVLALCDPSSVNVLNAMHYSDTFFFSQGLCDWPYLPTECDQALRDFETELGSLAVSNNCFPGDVDIEDPIDCGSICRNVIDAFLADCESTTFLLRSDSLQNFSKGVSYTFEGNNSELFDFVFSDFKISCKNYILSLVDDNFASPTSSPTPEVTEDNENEQVIVIVSASVAGFIVVSLLSYVSLTILKSKFKKPSSTDKVVAKRDNKGISKENL